MSATNVLNHLVIGKESTFNTAVTPAVTLPIKPEGGIVTDPKAEPVRDLRAQVARYNDVLQGAAEHSGSFKMDLTTDTVGHVLLGALGAVTSAVKSGETNVYEHTFSESTDLPSYTYEQKIAEEVRRYAGAVVSGFKIAAEAGSAAVSLDFEVIAASLDRSSSPVTPAPVNENRFAFSDVQVEIDGSYNCKVVKAELEYKNNAEAIHTLCATKDPKYILHSGSELDITLDILVDATGKAELTKLLDGTAVRLDLTFTGASVGSSSNYKLEIGVPTGKYVTGEIANSEDTAAIVTLAYKAYSQTGPLFDTFKLTNITSSY